jgi:DNA-binding XRE family transcriptional regulator
MTFAEVKNKYIHLFEVDIESIFRYEIKIMDSRAEYIVEYNSIHNLYYSRLNKPFTFCIEGFFITDIYCIWIYTKNIFNTVSCIPLNKTTIRDISYIEKALREIKD